MSTSEMTVNELSWVSKDRVHFYAVEWRPANPKAVILLVHGLGDHCRRYDPVAKILCAHGIAMLGFDLRGHGQTQGKRGHIPSMELALQDIQHFLEETETRFSGIPCFLFGQSMGGMLVLDFALQNHPAVAGVVCSSPALAPGTPVSPLKLTFANLLYSLLPDLTMDNGLDLSNLSRNPQIVEAYKKDALVTPLVSARLGLDIINTGRWVEEHGEDFTLPILLMQGSADHMVSVEATRRFAARVPRDLIVYREWEGFFHETHNEPEQAEVVGTILQWVEEHS